MRATILFFITSLLKIILTKLKYSLLALLIFTLSSCNDNDEEDTCIYYRHAPATQTNAPATGNINQDINIDISYSCFNGCGLFGYFDETIIDKTITINVFALYYGCVCTQEAEILDTTYVFTPSNPGAYYFKFLQEDNIYLIDTIYVE